MGYHYSKIEIEDVGTFTVPRPVLELLRDESARATAAERDLKVALETEARQARRATVAEAEVARLRVALTDCQASEAYARAEMARLAKLVAQVSHGQEE